MTIAEAKEALVRVYDEIDKAEAELSGPADRVDLIVVFEAGRQDEDVWEHRSGWSATPGPKWLHAALLHRAAEAFDADGIVAEDNEPEEEK